MRVWSLRVLAQVLVVCFFTLLLAANLKTAFAQSDLGKISGFIVDQSGARYRTQRLPCATKAASNGKRLRTTPATT